MTDDTRRGRLRARAGWTCLNRSDFEFAHDLTGELDSHEAIRKAIGALRNNIVCLGYPYNEPCKHSDCTRCILTKALTEKKPKPLFPDNQHGGTHND